MQQSSVGNFFKRKNSMNKASIDGQSIDSLPLYMMNSVDRPSSSSTYQAPSYVKELPKTING